jgi:hypothetical protein
MWSLGASLWGRLRLWAVVTSERSRLTEVPCRPAAMRLHLNAAFSERAATGVGSALADKFEEQLCRVAFCSWFCLSRLC